MADFLLYAAAIIVFLTAVGLFRVLRGPTAVDRLMAVQLFGSGGIAALILAETRGTRGAADVALTLALLAAFAGVALVRGALTAGVLQNAPEQDPDDAVD